jgi:hypothetical protein
MILAMQQRQAEFVAACLALAQAAATGAHQGRLFNPIARIPMPAVLTGAQARAQMNRFSASYTLVATTIGERITSAQTCTLRHGLKEKPAEVEDQRREQNEKRRVRDRRYHERRSEYQRAAHVNRAPAP